MSTKKKTQTTASFDPLSMSSYNSLQGPISTGLQNNMSDPWTAMAGNAQLAGNNTSIFNQSPTASIAQNLGSRGINPNSPLFKRQIQNAGYSTNLAQNRGLDNLLLQAGQLSQGSAIAASQYQPLQTGQTSVNAKSGLGTLV